MPGALYFAVTSIYALVYFLPFATHRLLSQRVPGVRTTLILPVAWVSFEYIFQRWITPYGSWMSWAYTQSDHLALLQLASVTGIAGVSFVGIWLGSVAAWILRPDTALSAKRRIAVGYAVTLLAVLIFGQLRLAWKDPALELVRVAGIVPSARLMGELERGIAPLRRGEDLGPSEIEAIAVIADQLNDDLLARTRREARAGAKLVAWSETAARVLKRDEAQLLQRAGRLAAEEGTYIVLGYGVWDPSGRPPLANKVAVVQPSGHIAWEYDKAHPIVGAESPLMNAGDGILRYLDTPFGRVGAVICHDLDFPTLLRQASRAEIGLIVGPSADWRAITPLHADMSILRAIESGFWLLRPTSGGRSIATDPRGRPIAVVDYATDAIVAHVAAAPAWTLYGVVGDLFTWLCLAGFAALTVGAFLPRRTRDAGSGGTQTPPEPRDRR